MATIKRSIVFSPERRKKNGILIMENVPIFMRVSFGSTRIKLSTGYKIDLDKWDDKAQRVKRNCMNKSLQTASDINMELSKQENAIQAAFKDFEYTETMPSVEELKEAFQKQLKRKIESEKEEKAKGPSPSKIFWKAYDEFIRTCGTANEWTDATYARFSVLKNHLLAFNKRVSFETFNEKGILGFTEYMRKTNHRNVTVEKNMKLLRWFLRWCYNNGIYNDNTFEKFRPKLKSSEQKIIFLTRDELQRIRDLEIPETKNYLERVRDVFLFCCFTGLRYSDVNNLRKSDIKDGQIEITTIKTHDYLVIELNDHSRAILEKYKDFHFEGDKALPVISNQKMNTYLKELGKLAGIDEPIKQTYYIGNERKEEVHPKHDLLASHVGRRTFICNALSLGIPAQVVMKWTGHSDYKAMKPYIDIADDIKAVSMSKFNML